MRKKNLGGEKGRGILPALSLRGDSATVGWRQPKFNCGKDKVVFWFITSIVGAAVFFSILTAPVIGEAISGFLFGLAISAILSLPLEGMGYNVDNEGIIYGAYFFTVLILAVAVFGKLSEERQGKIIKVIRVMLGRSKAP